MALVTLSLGSIILLGAFKNNFDVLCKTTVGIQRKSYYLPSRGVSWVFANCLKLTRNKLIRAVGINSYDPKHILKSILICKKKSRESIL